MLFDAVDWLMVDMNNCFVESFWFDDVRIIGIRLYWLIPVIELDQIVDSILPKYKILPPCYFSVCCIPLFLKGSLQRLIKIVSKISLTNRVSSLQLTALLSFLSQKQR